MPDPIPVTITAGNFQQGYCYPASPQQFLNDLVLQLFGSVEGGLGFSFGPNRPPVDQQNLPWLRTDNSGIIDGWYTFSGDWVRPYPVPISSPERRLWVGQENDLKTYDGGADVAISDRTGPFWQVDHSFDFKVPLGPGTSAPPYSTIVAVNQTGGSEKVVLDPTTVPAHNHVLPGYYSTGWFGHVPFWDDSVEKTDVAGGQHVTQGTDNGNLTAFQLSSAFNGDQSGVTTPINLMNPFYGAFFIKRTARALIVAP